jgi:hypothetical protein
VKVRGLRIEPGETEAVLASLPGIAQCAVTLGSSPGSGRPAGDLLAAFLVREAGEGGTPAEWRRRLRELLPEPMVPAFFVELEALPLTPNGKVDRAALGRLELLVPEADGASAAPRTPMEELVAGIFAEVLGADEMGADDHFFDRGGHSLLATRAVSRLRRATGLELSVRLLFEHPTTAALARAVERERRLGGTVPPPPLSPVPRDEPLPLSFAQQRLFFLHQLDPAGGAYNLPGAVRLLGPLRPAALAAALADVVRRHEALRTTFATREHCPVQIVGPPGPISLPAVDLAGLPPGRRGEEARRLAEEEALLPFDLAQGPLLRCRLLRLGAADHVFLFTQHHIVSDGWSLGILVRELAAFYEARAEGRSASLPELPVQYADFAAWQRRWLSEAALDRLLDPWRERLRDADGGLVLVPDRAPRGPSGVRVETVETRLDRTATEACRKVARRHDATLFMALLAAFAVALHRASGRVDLVVATDVANRGRPEVEGLIGFFVNQVLVRLDLRDSPTFAEVLARTRREALAAYAHQDLPFDRLVAALAPERDASRRASLFQVKLVLQEALPDPGVVAGLRLSRFDAGMEGVKFDLLVNLAETADGLAGRFDYAGELFERETIERLRRDFESVLRRGAERPSATLAELAVELGEDDRRRDEERDRHLDDVRRTAFRRARRRVIPASLAE